HLLAVLDARLQFGAYFVTAALAFGLVRQHPFFPVFAQAQEFAALAKFLSGQIVERIHFVCWRSDSAETSAAKRFGERFQIGDAKFDFDFLGHGEILKRRWLFVLGRSALRAKARSFIGPERHG